LLTKHVSKYKSVMKMGKWERGMVNNQDGVIITRSTANLLPSSVQDMLWSYERDFSNRIAQETTLAEENESDADFEPEAMDLPFLLRMCSMGGVGGS
jgi:hypothetical protein